MKLGFILGLLLAANVWAAPYISDGVIRGGGQAPLFKNFAPNPFAEKNVLGWTASGSMAVARDTDAADKLNAVASFELNPTAAETFTSSAMTTDNDIVGNCEAQVLYKGNASTWDFALVANDGTTVLTEVDLTDATAWTMASLNYPCATGYKLQLQAADGTNTINVGNFYWGKATNLTSATPVTGWTAYTPTFDASFGSVTNKNFEYKRIADMLHVRGSFTVGTTTTGLPTISLPSGLTLVCSPGPTISAVVRNIVGEWNRSNASANTSKGSSVICRADTTGSVALSHEEYAVASDPYGSPNTNAIFSTGESGSVEFSVKISQWASSQTAVTVENTDIPWTACTFSIKGTTADPAQGTSPEVACSYRRVGENIEVSESILFGAGATVGTGNYYFPLPNNLTADTTKIKFGGVGTGAVIGTAELTASGGASAVQKNILALSGGLIQISMEDASGTVLNAATTTYKAAAGIRYSVNFSVPVTGWTKTASAPLLVGSVTSNSSGLERSERAEITGGNTIESQSGTWLTSAVLNSTGNITLNIAAGIFSSAPDCTCTTRESTASAGAGNMFGCKLLSSPTTSALQFLIQSYSGTLTTVPLYVHCQGPR